MCVWVNQAVVVLGGVGEHLGGMYGGVMCVWVNQAVVVLGGVGEHLEACVYG